MLRKEITVFKLGGSLLDLPDLKSRLSEAIDLCNSIYPVLVVGGGPLADLVYDYQSIHKYDGQGPIQALRLHHEERRQRGSSRHLIWCAR